MPARNGWERAEVLGLEVLHQSDWHFQVSGHGPRRAQIIAAVPAALAHISVAESPVEDSFCQTSIMLCISRPAEIRPDESCSCSMKVSSLTRLKIPPILE